MCESTISKPTSFDDLAKNVLCCVLRYSDIPDLIRFERVNKRWRGAIKCSLNSRRIVTSDDFKPHVSHPISVVSTHGEKLKQFDIVVLTTKDKKYGFESVEQIMTRCPNITYFGSHIDEISVICIHSLSTTKPHCKRYKLDCHFCNATYKAVIDEILELCTCHETTALMTIFYNKKWKPYR